jgi:hypothetical protein
MAGDHNVAHLMFYTPLMDGAVWGADLPKSPVMLLRSSTPLRKQLTCSSFSQVCGRTERQRR